MQQWRRHKACKGGVLVQTAVGESLSTTPKEGFGGCSTGGNLIVKKGCLVYTAVTEALPLNWHYGSAGIKQTESLSTAVHWNL